MSDKIFVLERNVDAAIYVFLPSSLPGRWKRTDSDIFLVRSEESSRWTVQNVHGAVLGWTSLPGNEPPEGLWTSKKDEKSFEYTGRFIAASTQLSKEYEEQEKLRKWSSIVDKLEELGIEFAGLSVLDFGCGAGAVSSELTSRGALVRGLDRDPVMVATSKRRVPVVNFSVAANLIRTDQLIESAKFDLIWCSYVISYLSDPAGFLSTWINKLAIGGFVVLIDVAGLFGVHEPLEPELSRLAKSLDEALEPVYFANYGDRLAEFCRQTGELEVVLDVAIADDELAFAGRANTACLEAWKSRLNRPFISKKIAEVTEKQDFFRTQFMACLQRPDHRVNSFPRLVVARRISRS